VALADAVGWIKSATAMQPPLYYRHYTFPTVVWEDICNVAGPKMPGFPPKTSPPSKHW
jgi:hypothetical protein